MVAAVGSSQLVLVTPVTPTQNPKIKITTASRVSTSAGWNRIEPSFENVAQRIKSPNCGAVKQIKIVWTLIFVSSWEGFWEKRWQRKVFSLPLPLLLSYARNFYALLLIQCQFCKPCCCSGWLTSYNNSSNNPDFSKGEKTLIFFLLSLSPSKKYSSESTARETIICQNVGRCISSELLLSPLRP